MSSGQPLFRQTLLVLVGALMLSHLAGFLALVLLSPGNTSATTFSGVALEMADPECSTTTSRSEHPERLRLARETLAPPIPASMQTDTLRLAQLSDVLDVPESGLRLAWSKGSEIGLARRADIAIGDRTGHVQETVFLGELLIARQWADYWCVGRLAPKRWIDDWRARITLVLLLSFAALLPLAWLFARRLSRPIHDFANAADAIGRDEQAPLLKESGPSELRVAACALNAMQSRIQDQLREREAMVAAIAHDLRTPLSRIAFRAEAAGPGVAESVQRDIEQMNAMITATLEFAREGQRARGDQRIDLCNLLRSMVEDERLIGHEVRFSSTAETVVIEGSDVQLGRLFQNLLENARHFGGSAELNLRVEEGAAVVEIADQGPGIDPAQFEHMFRPFSRGEPSRNRQTGGTGLGLSITRAIARRHGGDIRMENRGTGGLCVIVTLPLADHGAGS